MAETAKEAQLVRERITRQGGSARFKISSYTLEEFFILGVLKDREMYGLEIARSLSSYSEFGLSLGRGVIYPTLKTLAKEGALSSRLESGRRPLVYYSLTSTGLVRLKDIAYWLARLGATAKSVAGGKPAAPSTSHIPPYKLS